MKWIKINDTSLLPDGQKIILADTSDFPDKYVIGISCNDGKSVSLDGVIWPMHMFTHYCIIEAPANKSFQERLSDKLEKKDDGTNN